MTRRKWLLPRALGRPLLARDTVGDGRDRNSSTAENSGKAASCGVPWGQWGRPGLRLVWVALPENVLL